MENLNEKYSRIRKKHPKVNLESIDKIRRFVVQENKKRRAEDQKEGIKKAEIISETGLSENKVGSGLGYLVESKYLHVTVKGGRFFGFSTEKKDGTYGEVFFDSERISRTMKEWFRRAISFFKSNSSLLDSVQSRKDFEIIVTMENEKNLPIKTYNQLVQKSCWDKGHNNLEKLSFRSTANKYA